MDPQSFNRRQWSTRCHQRAQSCQARSLSPSHLCMILGQEIDTDLESIPAEYRHEAIAMARDVGYETADERAEYRLWMASRCAASVRSRDPTPVQ